MTDKTKLAYYGNYVYREGYEQGRKDAVDELYSHRCKEMQDDSQEEPLVCIWKSWFDAVKEKGQ